MSLIPEELKTRYFPCPNCGQVLADDVSTCRYCSFEIPESIRIGAVEQESKRNKDLRLASHRNMMVIGAVFCIAGLGMVALPFLDLLLQERLINFSCLSPFVLIGD